MISIVSRSFFFFQAEDGIRDLVRSRGLGDVYKRQEFFVADDAQNVILQLKRRAARARKLFECPHERMPVSYTHLTLPTSDLV